VRSLTQETLQGFSPERQHNIIGERLFPLVRICDPTDMIQRIYNPTDS
jgi:hypothetical protein